MFYKHKDFHNFQRNQQAEIIMKKIHTNLNVHKNLKANWSSMKSNAYQIKKYWTEFNE